MPAENIGKKFSPWYIVLIIAVIYLAATLTDAVRHEGDHLQRIPAVRRSKNG